ncbi:carbonic anhydrase [Microbacterium esteraromaticum]|uniref:carbonic anhydrase n=1 Tax=Microbacterium esteraromaticum TaxID=57043 RepID=A0A939DWA0_9MICO|nr:carbonic anhydrase [Microbacterium esteraromaticum]MBN7793137.1 carbonic anhydrase [Microbacterium esteraromaticum]MBN8205579.1 carbonic anhydrase [Microbacterium esteraromaticum]MBN8415733.1 carbonic anhydrase [Microbacterium esteraromaticum]MBN8423920.1 carbonic anhydrase [Microbacterium esteraromaticum]MBY6060545.1 carbonic anhydrase [Microbacterium esteraromaticum]
MTTKLTPAQAWQEMRDGNRRFVAGEPAHPHQDVNKRHELADGQAPIATLFGCSDSRLAAEIIFDKGLGDLFVVRNAGQVIGESIVASLEYAVGILGVPLIVVLAHDSCGAVRAAIDGTAIDAAPLPAGIWKLIAPIVPAARKVLAETGGTTPADIDAELVGREHLRNTVADLLHSSELISNAVAEGRLGIVGANYRLAEGTAVPAVTVGIDTEGNDPASKEESE